MDMISMVVGLLGGLVAGGIIVFVIVKPVGIETADFTEVGDVPKPITIDKRSRTDSLERPIVNATCGKFFIRVLPEEFSGSLVKADQAITVRRAPSYNGSRVPFVPFTKPEGDVVKGTHNGRGGR